MNAWDQARLERVGRRTVSDSNRVGGEGDCRNPTYCHDYPPQKPAHSPERRAAIQAAMGKMEAALNGR